MTQEYVKGQVAAHGLGTIRHVYPAKLWGTQDLYVLEKPAPEDAPSTLLEQLRTGGIMVLPVGALVGIAVGASSRFYEVEASDRSSYWIAYRFGSPWRIGRLRE